MATEKWTVPNKFKYSEQGVSFFSLTVTKNSIGIGESAVLKRKWVGVCFLFVGVACVACLRCFRVDRGVKVVGAVRMRLDGKSKKSLSDGLISEGAGWMFLSVKPLVG